MTDIRATIHATELVLTTIEGLIQAIDAARKVLSDSTAQLKQSIIDAREIHHTRLAADRREADEALEKKFAGPRNGGAP